MKVGDKVWVFFLSAWQKAVVVPQPADKVAVQDAVYVWVECVREVFCYEKQNVKGRND
jgi:hypothetical protein